MTHSRDKGFSLVELLVVMAILAALTTVAIRAVTSVQSQSRYQQTTHTLDDLRSAMIGSPNIHSRDGSIIIDGFVADVGRLPQAQTGDTLAELTTNPGGIPAFSFGVIAPSDHTVTIGAGWQGPYIRLGAGQSSPIDGWGNPFQVRDSAGAPITAVGTAINEIRSLAADKLADDNGGGADGYNLDVGIKIPTSGVGSASAQFSGYVKMLDSNGLPTVPLATCNTIPVKIWVCYFGPDGGAVAEVSTSIISTAFTLPYLVSGPKVTIGPRILKAYVIPESISTFNAAAVAAAVAVSQPLTVTGTGGSQTVPNLVVPNYNP